MNKKEEALRLWKTYSETIAIAFNFINEKGEPWIVNDELLVDAIEQNKEAEFDKLIVYLKKQIEYFKELKKVGEE